MFDTYDIDFDNVTFKKMFPNHFNQSSMVCVVWYGMVWYGMVWYGVVWCGMVWYGVVWCGVVWHGVVWYWYGVV